MSCLVTVSSKQSNVTGTRGCSVKSSSKLKECADTKFVVVGEAGAERPLPTDKPMLARDVDELFKLAKEFAVIMVGDAGLWIGASSSEKK